MATVLVVVLGIVAGASFIVTLIRPAGRKHPEQSRGHSRNTAPALCTLFAPAKLVRAPEVRLLYGDMTLASVGAVFVTTSRFTTDATAFAEAHEITLIDGQRHLRLVSVALPDPRFGPTDRHNQQGPRSAVRPLRYRRPTSSPRG